jgi:hypothetical protein
MSVELHLTQYRHREPRRTTPLRAKSRSRLLGRQRKREPRTRARADDPVRGDQAHASPEPCRRPGFPNPRARAGVSCPPARTPVLVPWGSAVLPVAGPVGGRRLCTTPNPWSVTRSSGILATEPARRLPDIARAQYAPRTGLLPPDHRRSRMRLGGNDRVCTGPVYEAELHAGAPAPEEPS